MRLGLRLPLQRQETLPSFVSYLAQKNGSRHVQDFVEDMDLSWRRLLQLDLESVRDLAELAGTDADVLVENSYAPVGDSSFAFRGSNLTRSFLDRSALKFCPICVEADRDSQGRTWGRALWQLDPLHVCPHHCVLLGALGLPDYPRCPHDFAGRLADRGPSFPCNHTEKVGDNAADFARYLGARFYQSGDYPRLALLDDLPVDVLARLCENVGILVTLGPAAQPKALSPGARAAASGCGFAICSQGPDTLSEAYESIRRSSTNDRGGFYADFGFFTRWLQRLSQPDRYRPILDHFRAFVFENYPLAPGQMVLGQVSTERRWFTWADLGRTYGLSSGRLTRFQQAVGIEGDALRRVRPCAHDAQMMALSAGLDRRATARRLNVHPSAIDGFVEAGLLRHAVALPGLDKLFLPADVDALLASVTVNAMEVARAPHGSFPIRTICHKAKVTSVDLLRAQIEVKFRRVSWLRSGNGLSGLHFDLVEVLDHFEGQALIGLTRADLRKRLHVNSSTVGALLRRGLITGKDVRDPRSRRPLSLIAPEELDRFLARYVPLGLIAHELGTQARHVAARLDKAEVWPIPLLEQCSKIYLRDEVTQVIAI